MDEKKVTVCFYESDNENKPVKEWLQNLDKKDRVIIGKDIKTIEYSFPVGMPLCKVLKSSDKLYEVRSDISDKRKVRVLFTITSGCMVLLHAFIKKQQTTPKQEIDLALKRKKKIKLL